MRPNDLIDECKVAHRRVLESLAPLDDDAMRGASLLPGWSRGHVITHLARNADCHTWLFEGAAIGEVRCQYPTLEARLDDSEAGALRMRMRYATICTARARDLNWRGQRSVTTIGTAPASLSLGRAP